MPDRYSQNTDDTPGRHLPSDLLNDSNMAEFLTTHATAYVIERVIQRADERLVLVTPYLQLSRTLAERLRDADRRGVRTVLVYGKDELNREEHQKLAELEHLSLLYLENLHAKCYLNEEQAVVGSMNLYEFSEKTNREMGVLLTREQDPEAFADALCEVESVLAAAQPRTPKGAARTPKQQPPRAGAPARQGTCIRCRAAIRYRPDASLCGDCYTSWACWRNENYEENFCHLCGESHPTSKAKPLCYGCFCVEPFSHSSSCSGFG